MVVEAGHFTHPEVIPTAYDSATPAEITTQRKEQLGDLADMDHDTAIAVINTALRRYHALHEEELIEGVFPRAVIEKAVQLDGDITELRKTVIEAVQTPDAEKLKAKICLADEQSEGMSPKDRFLHRLSQFARIRIVTDFDGTLTEDPNSYLMRIPGSSIGEQMLVDHGRQSFAYAAALSWVHPLQKTPEAFRQVGKDVTLRNGVKETLDEAKANPQVKDITILSANFEPIVIGGLDQLESSADGVRVLAVTPDDIRSTDKGSILTLMALEDIDTAVFFLGDGSSDEAALAAHGFIAGYGALENAGFAKQLKAANEDGLVAPFFLYGGKNEAGEVGTFDEVRQTIQIAAKITHQTQLAEQEKQNLDKLAQTREALLTI